MRETRAMRLMIVDDERIIAEELRQMILQQLPDAEIVAVCHDGEAALQAVAGKKPDVVFLDIQMPEVTGLEVARQLLPLPNRPYIIFSTAHHEFALEAFAVDAVDYILKPYRESDIQRVLNKVSGILAREPRNTTPRGGGAPQVKRFSVEIGDRMEIVDVEKIQMVYAKDRSVYIQTVSGEHWRTKMHLQEFESKLPPERFFRCHRNYIVNVGLIKQIATWFNKGYLLIMDDPAKTEIPVGRVYVGKLKEYIEL